MTQPFYQKILYYSLSFMLLISIFYLLSVFDTFGSFWHLFDKSHLHKWHTLFRFCFVIVFGIVNHCFFVPHLYIPKRYVLFFTVVILCFVMMLVLPDILLTKPQIDFKRFEPEHPNPLPPSPLVFEMVIMFLLFFIGTFTSIAIRTSQYVAQIKLQQAISTTNKEQEFVTTVTIIENRNEEIEKQIETALTVTMNYSLVRIDYSDILFIKSMDNYLQFHLKDKKPLLIRMTLKDASEKLPQGAFLRVHKSYIVATAAIESIRNKTILIDRHDIPIGKAYEEAIFKVYEK
jgi:DNA-binding LytR/AlgR family response regulator